MLSRQGCRVVVVTGTGWPKMRKREREERHAGIKRGGGDVGY
jgi:hypothetical protein